MERKEEEEDKDKGYLLFDARLVVDPVAVPAHHHLPAGCRGARISGGS